MSTLYKTMLTLTLFITMTACTPLEVKQWFSAHGQDITDEHADAVLRYAEVVKAPDDCFDAVELVFPPEAQARMKAIVQRESGNVPTAANRSSSARGCLQLLMSLHSWRFAAAGCTPAQWADPLCNIKAGHHLWREAGWSPWSL